MIRHEVSMTKTRLPTVVQSLVGAMESLAALGAKLRSGVDGTTAHDSVAPAIDAVVRAAGLDPDEIATLDPATRLAVARTIRALFRQAFDLVEHPERPPGWLPDDPVALDGQGRMSIPLADAIADAAAQLDDLSDRLARPAATFLDVGTGVGWLAIALARRFPQLRIVGIDVLEPALDLARGNVAQAGLDERITLRRMSVTDLDDEERFDAAFLASPFLPREIIPAALERVRESLAAGGWLLFGLFATVDDPGAVAAQRLRAVRAGGYPWSSEEGVAALAEAGLHGVRLLPRTWSAPVAFLAGQR